MPINRTETIVVNALIEEIHDILKSHTVEDDNKEKVSYVDDEGNITIPLNNNELRNMTYTDFPTIEANRGSVQVDGSKYTAIINELNEDIMKMQIERENFYDLIYEMFKNEDYSIYGMIAVWENKRINILHPMTARLIKDGEIILPDVFTLMVYTYKSSHKPSSSDLYEDLLIDIMNSYSKSNYKSKPIIKPVEISNFAIRDIARTFNTEEYSIEFEETGDISPQYALIPVQLMSTEIAYPYYGFIYSELDDNAYWSASLSPMMSGNIMIEADNPGSLSDTCTGGIANNSFKGLATLNNMNLYSMFSEYIFEGSYPNWTHVCRMYSIFVLCEERIKEELLTQKDPTPEEEVEDETTMTSTSNGSDTLEEKEADYRNALNTNTEPQQLVEDMLAEIGRW